MSQLPEFENYTVRVLFIEFVTLKREGEAN